MWTDCVHVIFLALLVVICRRTLLSAKRYGERLRHLRAACETKIRGGETFDPQHYMLLVQDKRSKKYVYDNSNASQHVELERVLKSPNVPLREILFRHVADVAEMSRMMAFYKDEVDDHVCVSCIET